MGDRIDQIHGRTEGELKMLNKMRVESDIDSGAYEEIEPGEIKELSIGDEPFLIDIYDEITGERIKTILSSPNPETGNRIISFTGSVSAGIQSGKEIKQSIANGVEMTIWGDASDTKVRITVDKGLILKRILIKNTGHSVEEFREKRTKVPEGKSVRLQAEELGSDLVRIETEQRNPLFPDESHGTIGILRIDQDNQQIIIETTEGKEIKVEKGMEQFIGRKIGYDPKEYHDGKVVPYISGTHCRIRLEEGQLEIADCASRNGTFITVESLPQEKIGGIRKLLQGVLSKLSRQEN
jgi:hypothetical protein